MATSTKSDLPSFVLDIDGTTTSVNFLDVSSTGFLATEG